MIEFCFIVVTVIAVSFFLEIYLCPKWRNYKNESKILNKMDTSVLFDTSNNYKAAVRKNNNDLPIDFVFEYDKHVVNLFLEKIKEVNLL